MAEEGFTLGGDEVKRTRDAVFAFEQSRQNSPSGGASPFQSAGRPPIRVILLDDLTNVGSVDAAVTVLEQSNDVQSIRLLGKVNSGTFKLTWTPPDEIQSETTDFIDYEASAFDVQLALEVFSSINRGDIRVTKPASGTWLVVFMGQYEAEDVEPLAAFSFLSGELAGVEVINEMWVDNGRTEKVRIWVPIAEDTTSPLRAGVVVGCVWVHTAGYCVAAAECRDVLVVPSGYDS